MKGVTYFKWVGGILFLVALCLLTASCAPATRQHKKYLEVYDNYILFAQHPLILNSEDKPEEAFVEARTQLYQGNSQGAYTQFEQLAASCGDTPEEQQKRAHCINGMAVSAFFNSNYTEAEALYTQAIKLYIQAGGGENAYVAACWSNMALLSFEQMDYETSQELALKAVYLFEEQLPEDHPHIAVAHVALGNNVNQFNKFLEAKIYYDSAYKIMYNCYGKQDVLTMMFAEGEYNILRADVASFQFGKNLEQCRTFYDKQLKVAVKALGEEHPYVASIHEQIAMTYIQQYSTNGEVMQRLAKAEEIYLQVYGEQSMQLCNVYNMKALYFADLNAFDTALEYYAKENAMLEKLDPHGLQGKFYAYNLMNITAHYISESTNIEKGIPYYLKAYYILSTYFDNRDERVWEYKELIEKGYEYFELGASEDFEDWLAEQMEYYRAQEDVPMRVEGYEYLYE